MNDEDVVDQYAEDLRRAIEALEALEEHFEESDICCEEDLINLYEHGRYLKRLRRLADQHDRS